MKYDKCHRGPAFKNYDLVPIGILVFVLVVSLIKHFM